MAKYEKGKKDVEEEDVYSEEGQEELIEGDEINEIEEGFMEGYLEEGLAKCETCGKVLKEPEETVELEIDDEIHRFCSEKCAEEYKRKS